MKDNSVEVLVLNVFVESLDTSYITGDLNTWNGAKRAEEKDRVKHI